MNIGETFFEYLSVTIIAKNKGFEITENKMLYCKCSQVEENNFAQTRKVRYVFSVCNNCTFNTMKSYEAKYSQQL